MNDFESLLFIPEGSLLNEKLAARSAIRQTAKHFGQNFGPAERLKYNDLVSKFKLLSQKQRINALGQAFFPNQKEAACHYFEQQRLQQYRLVPGSQSFLERAKGKLNLLLYGKEKKAELLPRLKKAGLTSYFDHLFFADDFPQNLPDKAVFLSLIKQTGLDPNTILVIGTNLAEEIQGAENANLASLWLAPKKEKIPISPHPTLHLTKLSDLLFYLNIE